MPFRGIMPLSLVSQLIGGVSMDLWNRLRFWADDIREKQARPHFLEWFQWLAELLDQRGRTTESPAYLAHRGWRSPRE